MNLYDLLKFLHILTVVFMAAPLYNLVVVNERVKFGKAHIQVDRYFENLIRGNAARCYVFQATALVTGIALLLASGMGAGALVTNATVAFKFFPLLFIVVLLGYVHTGLQPRIDALFAGAAGSPSPQEVGKNIMSLRLRRRRIASICMFVVLTISMLGVRVAASFPVWLAIIMVIAIALFTYRAYKSVTPYGWA